MSNLSRWQNLTSQLETPDNYIDLAWYSAVLTSLERRVFYGDLDRPHFINGFFLLVGPPAIGKGAVMREAHKLVSAKLAPKNAAGSYDKDPITGEPRRLYQAMPDTVTFEKLIEAMSKSTKTIKYTAGGLDAAYSHGSCYFHLEELSSLLKPSKSEDVARFLLCMYDCSEYKYATKHHGTYLLKQPCLNFMAGTQLDFIRKAEATGLLGEGLFSRFIICYETVSRKAVFEFGNLTDEQKADKAHLSNWLAQLSLLFGSLKYASADVEAELAEWWTAEKAYLAKFGEGKLANYFARRKDHVKRLAAAIHFTDSTDLVIPIQPFRKAMDITRRLETTVINMVSRTGRNVLFPLQERLLSFIETRPRTVAEVMELLRPEADLREAAETVKMLVDCKKITMEGDFYVAVKKSNEHEPNNEPSAPAEGGIV